MNCNRCGKPFSHDKLLEGFCEDCITALAEQHRVAGSRLTKESILKAKEEVEGETAGLFAPGMLDVILEELLDDVENGEDRELAKTKAKNDIQSLGGIANCRERIKMTDAIGELAQTLEEEARRSLGVLMKLRKGQKQS
jgi:hypothetical protein